MAANGDTSSWCAVTGSIPQASVLGSVLFNISIDDLVGGSSVCSVSTYLGGNVDLLEFRKALQRDLDR